MHFYVLTTLECVPSKTCNRPAGAGCHAMDRDQEAVPAVGVGAWHGAVVPMQERTGVGSSDQSSIRCGLGATTARSHVARLELGITHISTPRGVVVPLQNRGRRHPLLHQW
jgi:hypothetical protein